MRHENRMAERMRRRTDDAIRRRAEELTASGVDPGDAMDRAEDEYHLAIVKAAPGAIKWPTR